MAEDETFETERLVIRDLQPEELEKIFDVYASNPAYLQLTSGAGGEPGRSTSRRSGVTSQSRVQCRAVTWTDLSEREWRACRFERSL